MLHRGTKARGTLLLIGLLGIAGALWLHSIAPGQGPGVKTPGPDTPPAPKAGDPAGQHPLDQPLAWLHEGRRNYTAVQDYSCTLLKRENVGGVLSDEHVIYFKFRTQPFSVYMRWLSPSRFANQEVAFMLGKNKNKMRVQSKGLLKVVGFVSIDVDDPRVMEHSRHTLYEAGIGNLIEHSIKSWETEKRFNKTLVKTAEYNFNNRRCIRIETTRTERRPEFYCYRSVLYIDKDSKMPIRTENYDWPRQGGPAEGELLEQFSYIDLRFNAGLTDREFNK